MRQSTLRIVLAAMMFGFIGVTAAPSARGQTIYEPVRYQFGQARPYYYGGTDPAVHQRASMPRFYTARAAALNRPRIYSDSFPANDAWVYGLRIDDAMNEAYANVPRYFVKGDLLKSGWTRHDGVIHVPAAPSRRINRSWPDRPPR